MFKTWRNIVLVVSLSLVLAGSASAYTGTLSSDTGGLLGTGIWVDKTLLPTPEWPDWTPATITWVVTYNPSITMWHYDYTLSVYKQEVSHFVVEASLDFTIEDLFNPEGTPYQSIQVGEQSGAGSPGLPGSLYGIKFDSTTGTTVHFSFDSPRQPVWGDFYSKDGKAGDAWNAVWNAGFLITDPLDPPANGSIDNHLLVPDTIVPEPTALMVLGIGLVGLGGLLARRRYAAR